MNSPRTIRLLNVTSTNLSITVHRYHARTQGSLRRGPALESMLIGRGQYVDVCTHFGVDLDEAHRLCDSSPEIRAFKRQGYLKEMLFPPVAVPDAPVTQVVVAPPVAVAVPTSATVEVKQSLPPAPLLDAVVTATTPVSAADLLLPLDVLLPPPPSAVEPEPEPEPKAAPSPDVMRAVREPSMDWSEGDLRAYAQRLGVDLTRAKSKTAVLRAIREKR